LAEKAAAAVSRPKFYARYSDGVLGLAALLQGGAGGEGAGGLGGLGGGLGGLGKLLSKNSIHVMSNRIKGGLGGKGLGKGLLGKLGKF